MTRRPDSAEHTVPGQANLLPPHEALTHRDAANRFRSTCLLRVALGEISVWTVIHEAALPGGIPLRRITLRQLLLAQPKFGPARVRETLTRLAEFLGSEVDRPTVGWLVDPRSRGRRLAALHDATRGPHPGPPWHGFPYTPAPDAPQHHSGPWQGSNRYGTRNTVPRA